jgi:hypothetical protein
VPLLLSQTGPEAGSRPSRHGTSIRSGDSAASAAVKPPWLLVSDRIAVVGGGSSGGQPAGAVPSTAVPTAPGARAAVVPVASVTDSPPATIEVHVVPRAAPTTTTVPISVAPPAPVAPPTPVTTEIGVVTYYAAPAGTCASPTLPFGTVVTVTNPANGLSVTCRVSDREADTARAIDLATSTFAEIAPLSQGVINAQLSW